jgi:hypothetical protein
MDTNSAENYSLPLHFGVLEIDQEREPQTGRFQIIYALGEVLARETLNALQLNDQLIIDEQIGCESPTRVLL